MSALDRAVRSGKALYAGISNYNPAQTAAAVAELRSLGTPCVIHQMKYSMFVRKPEEGLFEKLEAEGVGGIAFSPLALGMLTDRYLQGIPADSRAGKPNRFLTRDDVTGERLVEVRALAEIARQRGQSMAQMALAWVLRQKAVTSALIGASRVAQVEDCVAAANSLEFSAEELGRIDGLLHSQQADATVRGS